MNKHSIEEIIKIISVSTGININDLNKNSRSDAYSKWDSLSHVRIIMELEKITKEKINTTKIDQLNSIKEIFDFLNK